MVVCLIHSAALIAAVITEVTPQPGCMPNEICCAGGYNHFGKCKTMTECASEGQIIWKAGNETQICPCLCENQSENFEFEGDNRCWCDGLYGYVPQRPRKCRETNDPDACHCMSCSEGTYPNVKENGEFVEDFDKTKHCLSKCALPQEGNIITSIPDISDSTPGTCNCLALYVVTVAIFVVAMFCLGLYVYIHRCILFKRADIQQVLAPADIQQVLDAVTSLAKRMDRMDGAQNGKPTTSPLPSASSQTFTSRQQNEFIPLLAQQSEKKPQEVSKEQN